MIKDSEEEPSERKNIFVEIEDDSDEEKLDTPSNNQMTLKHDEEFPMRIPEMETEDIHQRAVSGNDLSERHVPESSHTEQVSDICRTPTCKMSQILKKYHVKIRVIHIQIT